MRNHLALWVLTVVLALVLLVFFCLGMAPRISDYDEVPPGTIVQWSGSTSNLPEGWLLCDGRHGTPDLQEEFFVAGTAKTKAANEPPKLKVVLIMRQRLGAN